MGKTYADRLSSKLVVLGRSPGDLRQLEQIIDQATSRTRPEVRAVSQSAQPHEHARSRSQIEEIGFALVGALLDFPDLLTDPEVEVAFDYLEGDPALMVAALRQEASAFAGRVLSHATTEPNTDGGPSEAGANKGIYTDEFLAHIPRSIHSFAVGRLASPQFELVADARFELLENARKLKRLSLTRENAAIVDLPTKAEAQGDIDSSNAMLREIVERAREKRGLT
jgi:DNA primase